MQFAELVLGVLAQFPESPDGCHCDRLRDRERKRQADYETRRSTTTTTRDDRATSVQEEEGRREQTGFKRRLPPLSTRGACVTVICCHTSAVCTNTVIFQRSELAPSAMRSDTIIKSLAFNILHEQKKSK